MTKRYGTVVALAAGLVAFSLPAMAQYHPFARSGLWTAFSGTSDDKRAVCGIDTAGAEGRKITVQQSAGETSIELDLEKDGWAIPANTPIDLQVQFDRGDPFPIQGTGSGRRVSVSMTFEQSIPFMRALRGGVQMRVSFASGNETPWTGGLIGSGRAIDAFNRCRVAMGPAQPAQPTQPFAQAVTPASSDAAPAAAPASAAAAPAATSPSTAQPAPSAGLPPIPPAAGAPKSSP